jgi:hypothetical protein
MGFFVYFLLFFIIADLFILLGAGIKIIPRPIPGNIRAYANFAAVLLSSAVVFFGIYNAGRHKIAEYEIELPREYAAYSEKMPGGLKIALISDLHLGGTNGERRLESIVRDINKLNPDIVCIAGDIFNDDYYAMRDPDKASALFREIDAKYGVYAVLGNHDAGRTLDEMLAFLERGNIKLLNDEYVIIGDSVILAGRLDASPIGAGGFGEMRRTPAEDFRVFLENARLKYPGLPVIVMDHNPIHKSEYGKETTVILAGHTHRGQIFPGSLITRRMYESDYGLYQRDEKSPRVIITQGVSTWGMPVRVGTSNEIAAVTVR